MAINLNGATAPGQNDDIHIPLIIKISDPGKLRRSVSALNRRRMNDHPDIGYLLCKHSECRG